MKTAFGLLVISLVLEFAVSSCTSDCQCDGNSVICSALRLLDIPRDIPTEFLDSLDLSSNGITILKNDSFLEFRKLSTLYLSYNEIEVINANAFATLERLGEIDLSNNALQFVHPETFANNSRLEVVSLSGNPLAHLSKNSPFLVSSSVRSLDLSYCSLNIIYPETFSKLPNLHVLDLSCNHLQELSVTTLKSLAHLRIAELGNNRWSCSCETQKLIQWANSLRVNVPAHRPVKCSENGQFRTLWSLADEEQHCRSIVVKTGDNSLGTPKLGEVAEDIGAELPQDDPLAITNNDRNFIFSSNVNIMLVFLVLPCMLGMSVFLSIKLANYITNSKNCHPLLLDKDNLKCPCAEDADRYTSPGRNYKEIYTNTTHDCGDFKVKDYSIISSLILKLKNLSHQFSSSK